jgi:hypothetical protein
MLLTSISALGTVNANTIANIIPDSMKIIKILPNIFTIQIPTQQDIECTTSAVSIPKKKNLTNIKKLYAKNVKNNKILVNECIHIIPSCEHPTNITLL